MFGQQLAGEAAADITAAGDQNRRNGHRALLG
jgi:hypothetical protein